jgi:hypothetical protein
MTRVFGSAMLMGLWMVTATPAIGQEAAPRPAADTTIDVDESWYYQPSSQPTTYQPNPKAIIHRKAIARSANRQARLEREYTANVYRARPSVNPLPFQYNYIYGPPLVSDDWGNTQVSVMGEGNRATAPWAVGQQPNATRR